MSPFPPWIHLIRLFRLVSPAAGGAGLCDRHVLLREFSGDDRSRVLAAATGSVQSCAACRQAGVVPIATAIRRGSGPCAAIPPTSTCMNCHTEIATDSELLQPVRESYLSGDPIRWVCVHDLPDYTRDFSNHSCACESRGKLRFLSRGALTKPTWSKRSRRCGWAWWLHCHRNPEPHLRPKELVTDLDWVPGEDPVLLGKRLREELNINPSTSCSTCHR